MISRREVVTAGVLGTLAGSATDSEAAQQNDAQIRQELDEIGKELQRMTAALESGPRVTGGFLSMIRDRFTVHLRAAGKFPDFMEIGTDPFYEIYDWHVRHNQQIQITRISEQRFAIQWMFTQMILRFENDKNFLGVPFDRG